MTDLVRTVVLHGSLRKEFGPSFKVVGDTLTLIVRGIESQCEGFVEAIRAGIFKVKVNGKYLEQNEAVMHLPKNAKRIDITPHIGGAEGEGKLIIGAIILVVAIVASGGTLAAPLAGMAGTAFTVGGAAVTWGSVAMVGFALGYAGVSMMMAPNPQGNASGAGAEQRASFMFNGATNVNEQGGPVPVMYGRMRIGSTRISVDVTSEQMPYEPVDFGDTLPASPTNGQRFFHTSGATGILKVYTVDVDGFGTWSNLTAAMSYDANFPGTVVNGQYFFNTILGGVYIGSNGQWELATI